MTFDCLLLCDDYLSNEILIKGKEILFGLVNFSWGDQIAATEFFDSSCLLKKVKVGKNQVFFHWSNENFCLIVITINAAKINPYIYGHECTSMYYVYSVLCTWQYLESHFCQCNLVGKTKTNVTFWNRKMHWILL